MAIRWWNTYMYILHKLIFKLNTIKEPNVYGGHICIISPKDSWPHGHMAYFWLAVTCIWPDTDGQAWSYMHCICIVQWKHAWAWMETVIVEVNSKSLLYHHITTWKSVWHWKKMIGNMIGFSFRNTCIYQLILSQKSF